jgi:hypothetical protein
MKYLTMDLYILFKTNNIQIGNPNQASYLLKEIITEYPESKKYVKLAAKQLLAVGTYSEDAIFDLKHFYASEPNLHNDLGVSKLAYYLENCCKIKLGDFESAIHWFEEIIANPDTPQDAVYAMIDLAYTYLLMDNVKNAPIIATQYPELIPTSMKQFQDKTDLYINQLLSMQDTQNLIPPPPTEFKVYQNYPNPFNGSTTFAFDLPHAGKVSMEIYNIKGQLVKEYRANSMTEGKQKIVWDCKNTNGRNIASGVYFYRIHYEGKTVTKKMCYLK